MSPLAASRLLHHTIGLAAVAALLAGHTGLAAAGPTRSQGGALSQAARAVSESVSEPAQPSSPPPVQHHDVNRYEPHPPDEYGGYAGGSSYGSTTYPRSAQGVSQESNVSLELGLHPVKDSDGATVGSARLSKGFLGILLSGSHYFEQAPSMTGADQITMNVWTVSGTARLYDSPATEVWIEGGVGGTSSTEFERIMGPALGIQVEHAVTPALGMRGSARYYVLEQDIHASEARASIGVSYFSVGYRIFAFNVGPALRGPEVGVALRF